MKNMENQIIKFYAEVSRYSKDDPCIFLTNECRASVNGQIVIKGNKLEKLKAEAFDMYNEKLEVEVKRGVVERNYEEGLHTEPIELTQIEQWEEKYLKRPIDPSNEEGMKRMIKELLEAVKRSLTNDLNFEAHLIIAILNLTESIIEESTKFEVALEVPP